MTGEANPPPHPVSETPPENPRDPYHDRGHLDQDSQETVPALSIISLSMSCHLMNSYWNLLRQMPNDIRLPISRSYLFIFSQYATVYTVHLRISLKIYLTKNWPILELCCAVCPVYCLPILLRYFLYLADMIHVCILLLMYIVNQFLLESSYAKCHVIQPV